MKIRSVSAAVLLLVLALGSVPVLANGLGSQGIEQDGIDLFLASQRLLDEERRPPHMKVGMVVTTLGTSSEVNVGARVETALGQQRYASLVTEIIYLKGENGLAGFASIKVVPLPDLAVPVYIGAGAGYADGFRYQVFAGFEFAKNFFAEARYVNLPGGIAGRGLHLAAGVQFLF